MFMIHLPRTFKVGDTADCRINAGPARVTWREIDTLVIEPDDARTILYREDVYGNLTVFHCADDNGVYKHTVIRMSDTARGTLIGASDDSHYHESRLRYRAMRRGFSIVRTRGRENKRREDAGIGTFLLIDQASNAVVLSAATLYDIAAFMDGRIGEQQRRLN